MAYLLIVPSSNAAHDWPNDKQVCTWVGNLRGQHRLFRLPHLPSILIYPKSALSQARSARGCEYESGKSERMMEKLGGVIQFSLYTQKKRRSECRYWEFPKILVGSRGFIKIMLLFFLFTYWKVLLNCVTLDIFIKESISPFWKIKLIMKRHPTCNWAAIQTPSQSAASPG